MDTWRLEQLCLALLLLTTAINGKCFTGAQTAGCDDWESQLACKAAQTKINGFAEFIYPLIPVDQLDAVVRSKPELQCTALACYTGNPRTAICENTAVVKECMAAAKYVEAFLNHTATIMNSTLPAQIMARQPSFQCLGAFASASRPSVKFAFVLLSLFMASFSLN